MKTLPTYEKVDVEQYKQALRTCAKDWDVSTPLEGTPGSLAAYNEAAAIFTDMLRPQVPDSLRTVAVDASTLVISSLLHTCASLARKHKIPQHSLRELAVSTDTTKTLLAVAQTTRALANGIEHVAGMRPGIPWLETQTAYDQYSVTDDGFRLKDPIGTAELAADCDLEIQLDPYETSLPRGKCQNTGVKTRKACKQTSN
jgi:hypothetical protein